MDPRGPGLREARPWTNRDATEVQQVPKRLVVLGGGPVGCEMAQALHSLGAEETIVVTDTHRLLPRHEPFAGELVARSLRESGIDVRLGFLASRVSRPIEGGQVTVQSDDGSRIEADEILVATGRRANTSDIGLGTVTPESGGPVPEGPVQVDSSMRATGVPGGWLYAIGDVNGRNQLTHMGKYQARVCADVIAARARGLPEDGRRSVTPPTTSAPRRPSSPTRRSARSAARSRWPAARALPSGPWNTTCPRSWARPCRPTATGAG